ncbi:unnamed protein product [Somion occarium]|uniref:Methyltransferase domain-containing protein n=1 Tax=Somion occarium TaxID=3059160 RepID=A0ABP1DDV1_9APHY
MSDKLPSHCNDQPHSHDIASVNEQHYDLQAEAFDEYPGYEEISRVIGQAMLSKYPDIFDKECTHILDYACGTGLLSRQLWPHARSVIGVDISKGAVDRYNLRVINEGADPSKIRAIRAELKGEESELHGVKVDAVVCASAYHHFTSIDDMTRILVSFLKHGGSLLVADIMKNDQGEEVVPSDYYHDVPHTAGFSEEDMRQIFTRAGLKNFDFNRVTTANLEGTDATFFLARGVKRHA